MAIDVNFARFLISCRRIGVDFDQALTIGRLNYYPGVKETRRLLDMSGVNPDEWRELLDYKPNRYAESFLKMLGAAKVESLDAAAFEGATITHDLNLPASPSLKNRFDVVCDGGTIEHVMNFPVAVRNCMEMVKVNGHFIVTSPANNFFGRGILPIQPRTLVPPVITSPRF